MLDCFGTQQEKSTINGLFEDMHFEKHKHSPAHVFIH